MDNDTTAELRRLARERSRLDGHFVRAEYPLAAFCLVLIALVENVGDILQLPELRNLHLGFDFPLKPRIERRRRGPDFFDNFHRVLDYARKTRPDFLVHGGDLFFRAKIPQLIVDMVYQDLFEFAAEGIPTLIVPGNHERSILPVSLFAGENLSTKNLLHY